MRVPIAEFSRTPSYPFYGRLGEAASVPWGRGQAPYGAGRGRLAVGPPGLLRGGAASGISYFSRSFSRK